MSDEDVKSFLDAIKPFEGACQDFRFNYLAIKQEGKWYLVKGQLFLDTRGITDMPEPFQSENVLAGSIPLSKVAGSVKEFIDKLLSGQMSIDDKEITFPIRGRESYSFYYDPFRQGGPHNQHRFHVLSMSGSHASSFLRQPALDWGLRAAEIPYYGVQELAYEYDVGVVNSAYNDAVNVEITALPVFGVIDESAISGSQATIVAHIAPNLPTEKATLGYNVHHQQKVVDRGRVDGESIEWKTTEGGFKKGRHELKVPEGSVVHCFASYAGVAQHHYWISDPTKIPNPRTAAQEAFDPELSRLWKAIRDDSSSGRGHRFEAAVACLCWMLGFAGAPVDGITGQGVFDIIATTPQGDFVVIECTTGIPKDKISKLHDGAQTVRKKLRDTGHNSLAVLPVLVTSKSRKDIIESDLKEAEKNGILVITREDLEDVVLNHVRVMPNPDQLYREYLQETLDAKAKHERKKL